MTQPGFGQRFVVAALGTWRVSHLVAFEDGPGDVVVALRVRLGERPAGRLMDCFGCVSVWAAAALAPTVGGGRRAFVPVWLGLAGAAFLVQAALERPATGAAAAVDGEEVEGPGLLWREAGSAAAR